MDGHAVHFRALQFEAVLEGGDDLVDAQHGQLVRQSAMAGERNVIDGAADGELVDILDLREQARSTAQRKLPTFPACDWPDRLRPMQYFWRQVKIC